MAKYTSRYGFELPEGIDKVAPNPFNENFKKVDSLIKALDKKYIVKGTYTGNGVITTPKQIVEQDIDIGAKPVMVLLDNVRASAPHNANRAVFAYDMMTFGCPEISYNYDESMQTYTIAKLTDTGFKVMQCGYHVYVDGKVKASSHGYNKQGEEYYYVAFCDELPGNADAELAGEKAQMNYLGELDSLPDTVVAGDACTVDGSLYVFYDGGWIKASGGGSSGGGGFKKIGYSDDCDYKVVSESSALAVFNTALVEANDGDTILIMPGIYSGNGEFLVNKNLTFVGVGEVVINFKVTTECVFYFDETNYEFVVAASFTTNWSGIFFKENFNVKGEDGPGGAAQSYANCSNCRFEYNYIKVSGTYTNCVFEIGDTITSGQYYGFGSYFYDCEISCGSLSTGENKFANCTITFKSQTSNYNAFGGGGEMKNCKIYLHRSDIDGSNDHGGDMIFKCCNFFGSAMGNNSTQMTDCYQYTGTKL